MTKITIDREAMRILIDELADGNFAIYPEIMKMLDGAAQPADAQPVAWPTPEDIQRATEDAKRFAVLFEDAAPPVPAAVPPGYALVPIEPDIALLEAFVGRGLMCGSVPHADLVNEAKRKYARWIAAAGDKP